jgi:DNA polymerase phi
VLQLLGKNGNYKFDALTKTKTVETILGSLSASGIQNFIAYLKSMFFNPKKAAKEDFDEQRGLGIQKWAVEQMVLLIRTNLIQKELAWVQEIVDFVILHGFFQVKDINLTTGLQSYLREKLFTILGHLHNINFDEKDWKSSDKTLNGKTWTFKVVLQIESLKEKYTFWTELQDSHNEEIRQAMNEANKIDKMIQDMSKDDSKELLCFELMYLNIVLCLYHGEEESQGLVLDLVSCFERIFPAKKSAKRKKDEPAALDVMVDILIGFLAKSSALLRNLALNVFKVFADKASSGTVDLIFEVLNAAGGNDGQDVFMEAEEVDSDNDDNGSSSSEEEMASDLELNESEEVDHELRQKVQEALSVPNEDENELSDLDDEQMIAFDSKLSEIFKQKKELKKGNKDTKASILHLKLRILDFVDVLLKSESNVLVEVLDKLLELYLNCSSSEESNLKEKIGMQLGKLIKMKPSDQLPVEKSLELMRNIHGKMAKGSDTKTNAVLTSICMFLIKSLDLDGTEHISKKQKSVSKSTVAQQVVDIFRDSLTIFQNKKSLIRPKLFHDLNNNYHSLAWKLVIPMLESTKDLKTFQKFNTIDIAFSIIKKMPKTIEANELNPIMNVLEDVISETIAAIPNAPEEGPFSISSSNVKKFVKELCSVLRFVKKSNSVTFFYLVVDSV